MPMQVVITVGGLGTRFSAQGVEVPKPLASVGNRLALNYLIQMFPQDWRLIFVVGEHWKNSPIAQTILNQRSDSEIIYTPYSPRGPIDTVLAAQQLLRAEEPVCVSYSDYSMVWNASDFALTMLLSSADAGIASYKGFHPTYLGPNTYCHLRVDEKTSQVLDLQEKTLFTKSLETEMTSAGLYYFKTADFMLSCLHEQLRQELKFGNEYYVSLALKAMMNVSPQIKVQNYLIKQILQLGTPADIERFEYWRSVLLTNEATADEGHENNMNERKNFVFKFIPENKKPTCLTSGLYEKEKQYWRHLFQSGSFF